MQAAFQVGGLFGALPLDQLLPERALVAAVPVRRSGFFPSGAAPGGIFFDAGCVTARRFFFARGVAFVLPDGGIGAAVARAGILRLDLLRIDPGVPGVVEGRLGGIAIALGVAFVAAGGKVVAGEARAQGLVARMGGFALECQVAVAVSREGRCGFVFLRPGGPVLPVFGARQKHAVDGCAFRIAGELGVGALGRGDNAGVVGLRIVAGLLFQIDARLLDQVPGVEQPAADFAPERGRQVRRRAGNRIFDIAGRRTLFGALRPQGRIPAGSGGGLEPRVRGFGSSRFFQRLWTGVRRPGTDRLRRTDLPGHAASAVRAVRIDSGRSGEGRRGRSVSIGRAGFGGVVEGGAAEVFQIPVARHLPSGQNFVSAPVFGGRDAGRRRLPRFGGFRGGVRKVQPAAHQGRAQRIRPRQRFPVFGMQANERAVGKRRRGPSGGGTEGVGVAEQVLQIIEHAGCGFLD